MSSPQEPSMGASDTGEEVAEEVRTEIPSGDTGTEGRWSEEDWRRWNAGRWYEARSQEGGTSETRHGTSEQGSQGGKGGERRQSVVTTTATDPWSNRDPWTGWNPQTRGEHYYDGNGSGGTDKITVPEFSAEEDRDGTKARGYLRKIAAWKRVTRIKPDKQALVLYNGLSGRAWRDAEEIDVMDLDRDDGVDWFVAWITEKYLDKEVVKVGKYMSDFFKNYKKGHQQEIHEYNMEFDRHVSKLKEVGCVLPGPCLAWWYLDKLRLDNSSELNLLASVGNVYELSKLQDAAVIQDRMNRRLWENGKRFERKPQQALLAGHDDEDPEELDMEPDYNADEGDVTPDEEDQEAHEAYVAFQNAKAKYNNVLKARGTNPHANQEERLKLAKARSYCSACHRKGHWHKDPECPKNKGKTAGEAPHTTHVVYYAGDETLEMIADCACSRTLAGTEWLRNYIHLAKEKKVPYMVIEQDENFKFGGPKLYHSTQAVVCWLCIRGRWFALKVSAVKTRVPLLVSRPALAALGMTYRMDTNEADFAALGLHGIKLGFTTSGHPKMEALDFTGVGGDNHWPDRVDWSVTEVFVPAQAGIQEQGPQNREVYMVRDGSASGGARSWKIVL